MKAIAESIVVLQKKIDAIENNKRLRALKYRLLGQKDGMIYALQMMGLDFRFTNLECTKGEIYQTNWMRKPFGKD